MRFLILITLSVASLTSWAQTANDVFRFSQKSMIGGSARSVAMGNSLEAIGGDPSAILLNPAGIGVYMNNEVQISPTLYNRNTHTNFDGFTGEESSGALFLSNLSGVFVNPESAGGWVASSFNVGITNRNMFDVSMTIDGENRGSSILDYFQEQAINVGTTSPEELYSLYPTSAGLAYDAFLLNHDSLQGYTKAFYSGNPSVANELRIVGRQRDLYVQVGGNYEHKIFVGGGLMLHTMEYTLRSAYSEAPNTSDTNTTLNNFTFNDYYRLSGGGVSAQFGLIWRVNNKWRLSAAFRSRDYLSMVDTWGADIEADFSNIGAVETSSPELSFSYRMQTPAQLRLGAGYLVNKRAIISTSLCFINYKGGRFLTEEGDNLTDFTGVNTEVTQRGQMGVNFALGGEWRYKKLSLRGGYNYSGSPEANQALSISTWSGGLGFNFGTYYIDGAFASRNVPSTEFYMYGGNAPLAPVVVTPRVWHVTLTGGIRF